MSILVVLALSGCGGAQQQQQALEQCNSDFRNLTNDYLTIMGQCKGPSEPNAKVAARQASIMRQMSNDELEKFLNGAQLGFTKLRAGTYVVEAKGFRHLLVNHGKSLGMLSAFKARPTLQRTNEWNQRRRFSRAYLDPSGDAVLEADLDLEGGVTQEGVQEFFNTFFLSVQHFAVFMQTESL
ncbi:MAG: YbjN domain-containing protein [Bradymonadia bacterium]